MKYPLRILIALMLLPVNLFAGKHGEVRVMTFNIRYNNPGDGIYSWEARRHMVVKVIREANPGIIGLQEVLKGQLEHLATDLPAYMAFGVGRDDGRNAGEFSPVLFDTARYSLLKGSVFWISETPAIPGSISWNSACTRIVTWVCLAGKRDRDTLYVFNTHFDHISREARENGARMLVEAIDSLCPSYPAVITGDFNSTDSTAAYRILTSGSPVTLFDTRRSAPDHSEISTTFIGFPADPDKREVIDFIFINTQLKTRSYRIIPYNEAGRYPSDHLPVLVNLEIK
jgi:endonuclease/exonuclease/phosphatase family metal-dependent hydrolase